MIYIYRSCCFAGPNTQYFDAKTVVVIWELERDLSFKGPFSKWHPSSFLDGNASKNCQIATVTKKTLFGFHTPNMVETRSGRDVALMLQACDFLGKNP